MNILIDAHYLDKKKEGNRTFVLSLLKGLKKLKNETHNTEFYLPVYRKTYWERKLEYDNFHWIDCSSFSVKRYLVDFPRIIRKHNIDLIQTIYHFPPFVKKKVKKVLIIHDLLPFSRPELFGTGFKLRFKNILRASVKAADKIICGSDFTRKEINKHLSISKDKIELISYGIDMDTEAAHPQLGKKYSFLQNIKNPFALFVGRLDKRKKISFLLDIMDILFEKLSLKLVIVGKKENISTKLFARIKDMEIQQKVFYPGEIPDKELEFLYKKADLLLYFPETEGFGYPIIEAMKFGLPYLTVNIGALKEIAIAEAFIDINNREDIIKKIKDLIREETLRKDFINKSKKKLKKYSDVMMASKIMTVYKDLK